MGFAGVGAGSAQQPAGGFFRQNADLPQSFRMGSTGDITLSPAMPLPGKPPEGPAGVAASEKNTAAYRDAAAAGDRKAQIALGYLQLAGDAAMRDPAQARAWFEKAAAQPAEGPDAGDAHAWLGHVYEHGLGVERDYRKALAYYSEAASRGHAAAGNNLGYFYQNGLGVERSEIKAMEAYRTAAERGNAVAQYNVGYLFEKGLGVAVDHGQALTHYRRAAEQGNSLAQAAVGNLYARGLGVQRDFAEALKWLRLAEGAEEPAALVAIGNFHLNGVAVERDPAAAAGYFRRAAEKGFAEGQNNLGFLYQLGAGVEKSLPQAMRWYERAAEQNHPAAFYNIGMLRLAGQGGVKQDYPQALSALRNAARLGHVTAANVLSTLYEQGRGVKRDIVRAKMWAEIAMRSGFFADKVRHDGLAAKMKPPDLERAAEFLRRCTASNMGDCG
jgi:TPR repeat protein